MKVQALYCTSPKQASCLTDIVLIGFGTCDHPVICIRPDSYDIEIRASQTQVSAAWRTGLDKDVVDHPL